MRAGLFPGQGVPAAEVLTALEEHDDLLTRANEVLGYDLRRRVEIASRRKGAAVPTLVAQPAMFVAGLASFRRAQEGGTTFDAFAGHSLGEYAALVAGGSFGFEHGMAAVKVRASAMQAAAQATSGGMAAILGLDLERVTEIAGSTGVTVANDNAPGQIVLSGSDEGLAAAATLVRNEGARSVLLEVSGPFHTQAMTPAASALRDALDHVDVRLPEVPVISNVTAAPYRAPGEIRKLLVEQLTGRVRFRESIEWLWQQGFRDFEDLGPGRVAAGLAQRIVRPLRRAEVSIDA